MGETAPVTEGAKDTVAETKSTPPAHLRDEVLLKFAGTATTIVGLVLLIASVIAMGVLSILKAQIDPWIPLLPLSLLLVLVGLLITVYFRQVIDRALNPKKPEPTRPPYGFVYPYAMPPPYYGGRLPPPGTVPGAPTPATAPAMPWPTPRPSSRFCIICGRRIPTEAKFCPYCRHAYPA
jgi:hypothetical protein